VYPLDVQSRRILSRELFASRRAAARRPSRGRGPGPRATVGRWLVAAGLRLAPDAQPALRPAQPGACVASPGPIVAVDAARRAA
jgi:hypothetical protein